MLQSRVARNEWHIIIQIRVESRRWPSAATAARCIFGASTVAIGPIAEQHQLATEFLQNDFRRVAVGARLVLPFSCLHLPFDVDLGALAKVGFGDGAYLLATEEVS